MPKPKTADLIAQHEAAMARLQDAGGSLQRPRPDVKRDERNKQRVFAAELVDALRGRHPSTRIVPVVTREIDEPERPQRDNKQKFRVLGAYKGSKWALADHAALVMTPNWVEPGGVYYQVSLTEPAFEAVRDRLILKGWGCGAEVFSMSGRTPQAPGTRACEFCELLYKWAAVYRVEGDEWVRNRAYISREQATIAQVLLEAANVVTVGSSPN